MEQPSQPANVEPHPSITNKEDLVKHMREMIVNDQLTNDEIMELHPELSGLFNNSDGGNDNGNA